MTRERIEELIAKKALMKEERDEIRKAADELGIKYNIKKGKFCRECYDKILMTLYETMEVEPVASLDGFVMRDPRHAFVCLGRLWNNALMSDRNVGELHPSVIARYFKKKDEDKN